MSKIHCHVLNDVPKTPHYAILKPCTIHVPGDESQRRPGHGYGAHTYNTLDYIAFTDVQEWKAEIQRLSTLAYPEPFTAIQVQPVSVEIKTEVTVTIHAHNDQ